MSLCGTDDDKQLKIELLSQWKLEAEFRKNTTSQNRSKIITASVCLGLSGCPLSRAEFLCTCAQQLGRLIPNLDRAPAQPYIYLAIHIYMDSLTLCDLSKKTTYCRKHCSDWRTLGTVEWWRLELDPAAWVWSIYRVFFHWASPKKLKYGKPRLGESTLT